MIRSFFKGLSLSKQDKSLLISLENLLGFKPKNIRLYKQALRHKSAAQVVKEGVKDSNERMEYLGDAVLGAIVAEYLFKKFPFKNEGFLTKLRSRIVSRENLGLVSKKMGLPQLISKQGDDRQQNKSMDGDAFEALIGAIYLDKGYMVTRTFIISRVLKGLLDVEHLEQNDTDYKSRLVEWAQRNKQKIEFKQIGHANGYKQLYTIHLLINDVFVGEGKDVSKKKAEQLAAEIAINRITEENLE